MRGSLRNGVSLVFVAIGGVVLVVAALKQPVAYHPVTESMRAIADSMVGQRVTDHSVEATDGKRHSPAIDSLDRPLVLIFIQDGCPCSEAAEPYFHKLAAAYGEHVSFLGVIDQDLAVARDWSIQHATRFPVIADAGKSIISACDAKRSVYVMLVTRGGTIEALWPGYSADMLVDLGERLAKLTGRTEVKLDTQDAPTKLASGCAF